MVEDNMTTKRAIKWVLPGKEAVTFNKGTKVIWDKVIRQHYIDADSIKDPNVKSLLQQHKCEVHYNNVDSGIKYLMSDQPEECRWCGMRTSFEQINKTLQFHTCQHCGAGYYVVDK